MQVMIVVNILKTLLVGFCAAAPLGPVALLVTRQTLDRGRKEGLVTGLGSMCADSLYALAALLTLGMINDFISRNSLWICLIGGTVLALIGLAMFINARRSEPSDPQTLDFSAASSVAAAVKTFFSALANPAAIAVMIALMTIFKANESGIPVWGCVLGVACGEMLWWTLLTRLVSMAGSRISPDAVRKVKIILGAGVIVFGLVLVARGLVSLF